MNPIFNQKYKTILCRHWQTTGACTIGVRCVFAHGQSELRNPNDPITLHQSILSDPKMLASFMTTPMGDVSAINAMVIAQQYESLLQEQEQLHRAFQQNADGGGKNILDAARQYIDQPHFDITTDPIIQKRITTAQLKLIVKQLLKLQLHPIIKCKVRICNELLEAQNIDSCAIMLNGIMERPTASQEERQMYDDIVDQASDLSIELIAEQKMKIQRLQKEQEIMMEKQKERVAAYSTQGRY